MIAWVWACAGPGDAEARDPAHFVLHGAVVDRGPAAPAVALDVEVDQGVIIAIGDVDPAVRSLDVAGRWLVPAVVDSHVHLAYLPGADALADGGVAGVVDLAMPLADLAGDPRPLRRVVSGPMITASQGYPTQTWGRDGYGLECADAAAAVAAVGTLADAGAGVIKLPVTAPPVLDDAALRAVVDAAHARGLKVASHALGDVDALRAATAGVDILAHTPTEALSEATLEAWRGRVVISTLASFDGGAVADANLRALADRDVTVLYGSDYGNAREAGVNSGELARLRGAGFSDAAIVDMSTSVPAAFWGFTELGAIEVGRAASLLVVDADPRLDASALARPVDVYIDGVRR